MSMHPDFYKNNPFRPPQWRAERVMQLLTHGPTPLLPRRYDDHYVRVYRRFLLKHVSAGHDEALHLTLRREMPHVYDAHNLHYSRDIELRQVLEARLLTQESSAEIAVRVATEERTVDYFEHLFFNVRDRLQHSDWVAKLILGPPTDRAASQDGVMTDAQRGYLYRLFAYHGGPLALDALISGIGTLQMPQQDGEVAERLSDALRDIVRLRATAAASVVEIDERNVRRFLKLALGKRRSSASRKMGSEASQTDVKKIAEAVLKYVGPGQARAKPPRTEETHSTHAATADQASADNRRADPVGTMAAGLAAEPSCVRAARSKVQPATAGGSFETVATASATDDRHQFPWSTDPADPGDWRSVAPRNVEVPVLSTE